MSTVFMEMRQRGQMTLTPRLQQSVRLLQLSALEFAQELQQALASNPFLEEVEDDQDEPTVNGARPTEEEIAHPATDETPAASRRAGRRYARRRRPSPMRRSHSETTARERVTTATPTGRSGPRRHSRCTIICTASSSCAICRTATAPCVSC